ncbi:MAG TPA: YARHG domain-containing protein [Puia sp.]|nr:YARHG domain-containing protein [Puia sp.]
MTLRQTEWFNISGDSTLTGRYSFASTTILTYDLVDVLTPGQRKICRNEIYARHGYIFRTPDMKAYFLAQPWYQPRYESVDDQLTDVERLNLQILQSGKRN